MVDGCISPIPCIALEIKEKDLAEPFGLNVKSMRIVFLKNNSPRCERTRLTQKLDPHGYPIVMRMQRMLIGQIVPESQSDVRQSE